MLSLIRAIVLGTEPEPMHPGQKPPFVPRNARAKITGLGPNQLAWCDEKFPVFNKARIGVEKMIEDSKRMRQELRERGAVGLT